MQFGNWATNCFPLSLSDRRATRNWKARGAVMTGKHFQSFERQYRILDVIEARSKRSARVNVYAMAAWLVALLLLLAWATGTSASPSFRH